MTIREIKKIKADEVLKEYKDTLNKLNNRYVFISIGKDDEYAMRKV